MKKNKTFYHVFDEYCLRIPTLPFNFYQKLTNGNDISDKTLRAFYENPIFKEALFLVSPDLFKQTERWYYGKIKNKKKEDKLKLTILKYATRITTRCTPFGLLAACGSGQFGAKTKIKVKSQINYTRFDIGYLSSVTHKLLDEEEIIHKILFYPNSSLYKLGNHYRYIYFQLKNNMREYYLDGVNSFDYLDELLEKANSGILFVKLVEFLLSKGINNKESLSFIKNLIKEQILVSELELSVTGKHYHQNLIEILKFNDGTISQILEKTIIELDTLQVYNSTQRIALHKRVKELIDPILLKKENKIIFQTDSFLNFENNNLDQKVQEKLMKVLNLFNKITPNRSNVKLIEFKTAFLNRFEASEVPLTLALDSEAGLGFGSKMKDHNSLLQGIPTNHVNNNYQEIIWTEFDELIQHKFHDSIANKSFTINIADKDVDSFNPNWEDLPDTFSSIIEIYNGEDIFMNGAGGSTALNLIGRFCYGDSKLMNLSKKIVQIEDKINLDKVIAEIAHVPQHRTVNIAHRPNLRKYEIPYLAKSGVSPKYQISITDILISIKNNRIVLRSKELNKEILPRLSNAHNYNSNSLPIYQFLCELQTQNKRSYLGFTWNNIFLGRPFLPRVEFEGVIISKATWNIKTSEFHNILKSNKLMKLLAEFKEKLKIPKLVQLVEGDNKLLINLENITSVKMLFDSIKNRGIFQLEEFLFDTNSPVRKNNDNSCNEFVISFHKTPI